MVVESVPLALERPAANAMWFPSGDQITSNTMLAVTSATDVGVPPVTGIVNTWLPSAKASFDPSGDQQGCEPAANLARPVPLALTTHTILGPPPADDASKAMRLPSGDQTGFVAQAAPEVGTGAAPEPSAFIVYT
jgi:hypothetical protein